MDAEGDNACHVDICAAANPCDVDAACSNEADGSQTCVCNDGFYGNGSVCFVDSCALSPCQSDSTCANDEDSFTCTCNAGFYLGTDVEGEEACHADVCDQADPCDPNASCSNNVDGSQTCVCNADFKGDGLSCTDIGLLNNAELTDRLADFDADAAGITSTKNVKKFDKALKKFPMKHVNNYVAECPNKRDVNALIAEREANEIVNEELLGWDISDACSYAKDLATANNRFLKRWSCVSQFGFDFNTKDLKKSNKKLRNKMKKVEKQIVKFSSTVNGLLGC
jgi:Notch-like protein/fibulin 1/2